MILRLLSAVLLATTVGFASNAAIETLFQKLLRVAGLTANPAQLRGPGDDFEPGDIWVVTVGGTPMPWTKDGGYSSPIFSPADGSLLALKGDTVVRIPAAVGPSVVLQRISGARKLVGFDNRSGDEIVVLLEGASPSPLVILSLASGKITPLPYDSRSEDDRRMLAQIRGQQRVYGDATLYTRTQSKPGLARTIVWTDVYLQRGNGAPQNVSVCDGTNCGEPARSYDGRRIAFVKI